MSTSTVRAKDVETKLYELVDLEEVLTITQEYSKGFSLLKCRLGQYLLPITNEGLYDILDKYSFFYKVSTSPTTYINLKQIRKYNSDIYTVYFDDVLNIKETEVENVISQTFTAKKLPEIKKILTIENDLAFESCQTSRNAKNRVSYKKASILRGIF